MRWIQLWLAVGGLVGTIAVPAPLSAQGFSLNEHGSCAMGRAGTGTASPCPDGSAMFFNPAGLASVKGGVASLGATLLAPRGSFTDDATGLVSDLENKVFPVPAGYVAHSLGNRFAVGLGVFAPYGLTIEWPTTSQGRYVGYKSVISTIYVQPTAAVQLGKMFSVGAGLDIDFGHVQLQRRVDLSPQIATTTPTTIYFANLGIPQGTDVADVDLTGNGTSVGFHLGVLVHPIEWMSLGIRYLSRQTIDINGGTATISQVITGLVLPPGNPLDTIPPFEAVLIDTLVAPQFQPGGPLTTQSASTALKVPDQLSVGAAIDVTEKLTFLFDFTWSNWSVFDTVAINFAVLPTTVLPEDFEDTYTYRFGGQYAFKPGLVFRLGVLFHDAAEPAQSVTPNLPEGPRNEFTAGVGIGLTSKLRLDLAYQYIDQADRRGRTTSDPQTTNGLYSFDANLFGATLSFTF